MKLSMMVLIFSVGISKLTGQTIATDKADYLPGETVVITGSGFIAGETVNISIDHLLFSHADEYLTAVADGNGVIYNNSYKIDPSDFGESFLLTAIGQVSNTPATTTFTDGGGSYTLKWYAADPKINRAPFLPTYEKLTPAQISCPAPSGGVGRASDPLPNSQVYAYPPNSNNLDAVTSLAPKDMALCQIVPYFLEITVNGSTSPENGVITFKSDWLAKTTSGGNFGFDPSYGLYCAFVDYSDPGTSDPLGNAKVDSYSSTTLETGTSNERIQGTVQVSGLDNGDRIIVELWVVLKCSIPAGSTGNVQTSLQDAQTGPSNVKGDNINTGNQTVPLLKVQEFFTSDVDLLVTKSDTPDPITVGDNLTYTIVITNNGPSVANKVVATDLIDINTTYVTSSVVDNQGASTLVSVSGQTITISTDYLNINETVTITLTVKVSESYNGPKTSGPVSGGSGSCDKGDLRNNISVSTISDDVVPANNSYCQPTNVKCPQINITATPVAELCMPANNGSVSGTVTGGFNNPFTVTISGFTLPSGYIATITATPVNGSASYQFGSLPAGSYIVTATCLTQCSGSVSAVITEPAAMDVSISSELIAGTSCSENKFRLTATATGGSSSAYVYNWLTNSSLIGTGNEISVAPDIETTYTVIAGYAGIESCNTTNTITVPAIPKPECIISGPSELCPSAPGTYTTTAIEGASYSWSVSGSASIEGSLTGSSVSVRSQQVCGESFTLRLTVRLSSGCTYECSKTVNINDFSDPVIVCPEVTGYTTDTGKCSAALTFEATATDNCSVASIEYFVGDTKVSFPFEFSVGNTVVKAVATDACNRKAECSFTVTVTDNQSPVLLCPSDITVNNDPGKCGADVSWTMPAGSDNCGVKSVTSSIQSGSYFAVGVHTVTLTVTDNNDNTSTCAFKVTVVDNQNPVLECHANLNVSCSSAIPEPVAPTATDNCGILSVVFVSDVKSNESCANRYTITRTYKASDVNGNEATCSQIITVYDNTPPTFVNFPEDETISCTVPSPATVTATDNCGGKVIVTMGEQIINPGYCYILKRTWTATDECGNFAQQTQTINIVDTEKPKIQCPGDKTLAAESGQVSYTVKGTEFDLLSATDNCRIKSRIWSVDSGSDGSFELSGTETLNGTSLILGASTVKWTVTDECGNSESCAFSVSVIAPPCFVKVEKTCDYTVSGKEFDPAVNPPFGYTFVHDYATAPDNETLAGAIFAVPDGQSSKTHVVNWFLKNLNTHSTVPYCTTEITVSDLPPVLTSEAQNLTVECDGKGNVTEYQEWLNTRGGAMASDDCGKVTWSVDLKVEQGCIMTKTVTATFTATDGNGQSVSTSAIFKIVDTTPPDMNDAFKNNVIVVPCLTPDLIPYDHHAYDICGGQIGSQLVSVVDTPSPLTCGGTRVYTYKYTDCSGNSLVNTITYKIVLPEFALPPDGKSTMACASEITIPVPPAVKDACGRIIVPVAGPDPAPASCGGDMVYTWTYTDCSGRSKVWKHTITMEDKTAPEFNTSLPADATVECSMVPVAPVLTATDNCGSATVSFNEVRTNGNCTGSYILTRTWIARDDCNNTVSHVQRITVRDTQAPVIGSLPNLSTIYCPAEPEFAIATATDDCDPNVTLTFNDVRSNGRCSGSYNVIRTWTATDACGNSSTKSQMIMVDDIVPPVIKAAIPELTVIYCPDTPVFVTPTASDNCSNNVSLTSNDVRREDNPDYVYYVTRTWTASDGCNASTISQTIYVDDKVAPVIKKVFDPKTIECPATPVFDDLTSADIFEQCSSYSITKYDDPRIKGDCPGSYSITRHYVVRDAQGNESRASQTITVVDNTIPVITGVQPDKTIGCPSQPVFSTPSAHDICSGPLDLTFSDFRTEGSCPGTYSVKRTWTANDGCGHIATASQTITVIDNTPPKFTTCLPSPVTIFCPSAPAFTTPSVTDACDSHVDLTFDDVTTPGRCAGEYSVTRTWTATDDCKNAATLVQTIKVIDNFPPTVLPLPAPTTIFCPDEPVFAEPVVTDACNSGITKTFKDVTTSPGLCGRKYSVTRTWTITDGCGNKVTVSQTIHVVDNTAPAIAPLPAPTTINCPAKPAFEQATASDACGTPFTLTYCDVRTNGGCTGTYTITRTWTALDYYNNKSTATQVINVVDNEPPVITTLPVVSPIKCPSRPSFPQATAKDNCSGNIIPTYKDVTTPGSCAGSYKVTRTWTAKDNCGNTATAVQEVVVIDDTKPVFSAIPAPSTINSPSVPSFVKPTATDACGSVVNIIETNSDVEGTCPGNRVYTRTWTASDGCGNTATASQTITVLDKTPPVFTGLQPSSTINCPADPKFIEPTVTDNSGLEVTVESKILETVSTTLKGRIVKKTWTATDKCGNSSTVSQTITVQDISAPVFTPIVATKTISCSDPIVWDQPLALDACQGNVVPTFTESRVQGLCAGSYTVTRTWTASDVYGNKSTITQKITVKDDSAPVITVENAKSPVYCPATPVFGKATATDPCGSAVTLTYCDVKTNGSCAGSYTVKRTWTARDACGNVSTQSQTVVVEDRDAPVISGVPAQTVIEYPATPVFATATAKDACGSAVTLTSVVGDKIYGDCQGSYSITKTWTARDACGNVSTAAQTITVTDTKAPVISPLPAETTILCPVVPVFATPTASDSGSGVASLTAEEDIIPGACAGSYTKIKKWTATDKCGNVSTASQKINVLDKSAPVFAPLPAPKTINCNETAEFAVATATDACGSSITITSDVITVPGTCGRLWTKTKVWTAIDACGNKSTASQVIYVQDITAPVINGLTFDSKTIKCGDPLSFETATATDLCGSSFTLTKADVRTNGPCAGSYTIKRTWTATDVFNNKSTATQTIVVVDDIAPVIDPLPDPSIITCPAVPKFTQAVAKDACGSGAVLTYSDVKSVGSVAGTYTIVRTWTAKDACGNSSTASQQITVTDNTVPVIANLPAVTTIEAPARPVFATATATDACGGTPTLTFADVTTPGTCAASYTVIRTWTATDAFGNNSTKSQVINVADTKAPVFAALPLPSTVECGTELKWAVPVANDAAGGTVAFSYEDTKSTEGCTKGYKMTRKWTATDQCGNKSYASQVITVQDTKAPVITTAASIFTFGECSTVSLPDPLISDCSDIATVKTTVNGIVVNLSSYQFPKGSTTVVYTASDMYGNTGSKSITVTKVAAPSVAIGQPLLAPVPGAFETNKLSAVASGTDLTYFWSLASEDWSITGSLNTSTVNYSAGFSAAVFTLTVTDKFGCQAVATINLAGSVPNNHCTYTQGFYGNINGKNCAYIGGEYVYTDSKAMMLNAFGSGPDARTEVIFGSTEKGKSFRLLKSEVENGTIWKLLPGGGTPAPLKGNATYSNPNTWYNVPLSTTSTTYGKIMNNLLSQTMTLFFNLQNDKALGSVVLKNKVMVTADSDCGSSVPVANSAYYFEIPQSVITHLGTRNTVADLYALANKVLGGVPVTPTVYASDVTTAVDAINRGFNECRVLIGFFSTVTEAVNFMKVTVGPATKGGDDLAAGEEPMNLTGMMLNVYPNPFAGKAFFNVGLERDTHVKIEIFAGNGVLLKVLLDEDLKKDDVRTVEFDAANSPHSAFIYKVSASGGFRSGTLIKTR